jgi:NTE family protein
MLMALTSYGVVVDSSVGAINAAFFASEPTGDGVERLEQIWLGVRRNRGRFPLALQIHHHLFLLPNFL